MAFFPYGTALVTESAAAPSSPTDGQLWWDTTYKMMWYYDSIAAAWYSAGSPLKIVFPETITSGQVYPSDTGGVYFNDNFWSTIRFKGRIYTITIPNGGTAFTATAYATARVSEFSAAGSSVIDTFVLNNQAINTTINYQAAMSTEWNCAGDYPALSLDFTYTNYTPGSPNTAILSMFYEIKRV
jgi:hypothetical protein